MSLWRKEASSRLPELQKVIASTSIRNPSDFWMQLSHEFERLCRADSPPIDLLSRIWEYAKWSAEHPADGVQFAVQAFFFESIQDTRVYRIVLPQFMTKDEYETVCGLRVPRKEKEK